MVHYNRPRLLNNNAGYIHIGFREGLFLRIFNVFFSVLCLLCFCASVYLCLDGHLLGKGRSKAVLLLWIFCVFSAVCLLCLRARLFICALWSPAGKGLTSWLSFVVYTVSLSLSHWYPGSGGVLDCIDSGSLHSSNAIWYS